MKAHIAKARTKADALYSKRDQYITKVGSFLNTHLDKGLMIGLVVVEIMQADSLDNIEEASNVSAAVDYDDYARR